MPKSKHWLHCWACFEQWKGLAVQLNASTIAPTLKIGRSHDMKA
jgi:hypothetical protein